MNGRVWINSKESRHVIAAVRCIGRVDPEGEDLDEKVDPEGEDLDEKSVNVFLDTLDI